MELDRGSGEPLTGLVLLPGKFERFIRLPGDQPRFIRLEQLILRFSDLLFPGFECKGGGFFRVLRDSDIEIEEEAEDLVRQFETMIKRRRLGNVIRLSVNAAHARDRLRTLPHATSSTSIRRTSTSSTASWAWPTSRR